MELFGLGSGLEIRYPTGETEALNLANELAARLDELVSGSITPFARQVRQGVAPGGSEAIYIGLAQDWAAELGEKTFRWWVAENDFGIRVVSGADCVNSACKGEELQIVARDYPLLLRAVWILLHELGWRHFMPNGVPGLEEVWVHKKVRKQIVTDIDRVWSGAVDHLLENIAGGTSNLGWSNGTDYGALGHPYGLIEGNLEGAMGKFPSVEASPEGTWLRHMGWTSSSRAQTNAAWRRIIDDDTLSLWDPATGTGHYTAQHKLYTDSPQVQEAALAYALGKVDAVGLDWVSLSQPDGSDNWDVDFNDADFGAKSPGRRSIELGNLIANHPDFRAVASGTVIQAYGETAYPPSDNVWPDPKRVTVIVMEAYRPPGRTTQDIIGDYIDDQGRPRCPLGIYQYLYSGVWGQGVVTAKAGSPADLIESVNRIRHLPDTRPKVLSGEAMTDFGFYGLGYYCYMRMVLDIGRETEDFTEKDFGIHRTRFFKDLFPTLAVRQPVESWYDLLLDQGHKPLLSAHLVSALWDKLRDAIKAAPTDSEEELRVAELCKYTRYLDLRNRFEAAQATADAADAPYSAAAESAYDQMMEWIFRIRDSGQADAFNFFMVPLNADYHGALGLGRIWDALRAPPGENRGADGGRGAWNVTPPEVAEFKTQRTGWIDEGSANNDPHGLTDMAFSPKLQGGWATDPRDRQANINLLPYKSEGRMKLWLVPGDSSFICDYTIGAAGAAVAFVNQASGKTELSFKLVSGKGPMRAKLVPGQLYEVQLTTYGNVDQLRLDWWTGRNQRHYLSFDPGREGDPCGFGTAIGTIKRSLYFLVPDGVTQIHFYAEDVSDMRLYYLDKQGIEQEDLGFAPLPRAYQSHSVTGKGRRIYRISGIRSNEIGFWLLNCPNLFSLHPEELLKPADA